MNTLLLWLAYVQEINVIGSRSVQLTVLTNKEFQEDSKPETILYGPCSPLTVCLCLIETSPARFTVSFQPVVGTQERETRAARIRSRLLFFSEERVEDGRKALSSLAVIIGRSMLEELGELPAGKADWPQSEALFWERIL